ncbi:amidohydrolase family protein [Sphingosinicella sp. LHD-64]|uniref:amidohydrolase family protein n=1 Tax=Sphingosinicella sp. LHD-64 TaxID=3072139 RepID=UPI00280DD63E|nr:amidohydrolase family protein [Sphingosinicella sp. LHD-64]MDQ8758352.1 amidohydrolase family protein [Sphingosinicella sp. LHD-64]
MIRSFAALTLLLVSTTATVAVAQRGDREEPKWDVNAPPGQRTRQVQINTDEGTWMNVDVSPDGRTIAFDLLGDIYTMPIEGGMPRRITSGLAFDMQPRFSPDGRQIAFTSDRGGGDNIWVMATDGTGARAITSETFRLLNNPTWSPDGRYIAARKHFTTQRSLGTGEIWLYHASGTGEGVALIERPNPQFQKELGEPAFSHDGRYIYFSRNTTPGNIFEYAQDANQEVFAIERYELASGERTQVAGGPGGAVRPEPSPDGRWLAFVHRTGGLSRLFVRDLRTGEQRQVYADLDQDVQETWAVHGVYPNMGWTPDSNTIVFWAGGKLRRVNVDGSAAAEIPFQVNDTRVVIDPQIPSVAVAPDSFTTRMPRFASVSPDGSRVVFETLGRLYIRDMAGNASPRLLTAEDGDFQLFPSWSRDGSRIVFVSWNDQRLGEVRTVAADGSGLTTVTRQPGHYRRPRFSPDGSTIVFESSASQGLTSNRWSETTGVYRVPANGGELTRILSSGGNPQFGAASDRVFVEVNEEQKRKLISVDLSGGNRRNHAQGEMVTGYEISPDGGTLAFIEDYNVFVTPFFNGVGMLNLSARGNQMPVTRATANGGSYAGWTRGGQTLTWTTGPNLYSAVASSLLRTAPGGEAYRVPTDGTSLAITVAADRPQGVTALVGARIVTMAGDDGGVIEDGVIVVDGNRIQAVGPRASVQIPAGARTVDVAGRTIIPGLIDGHAHGGQGEDDLIPQQNWSALSHLALGVTTVHDPSSTASEIFVAGEMQRAGVILAPRTFSSGEIVYGARSPGRYALIDSYDDALGHIRRLRIEGAHSIKNYNQPRRNQRQQVAAAARAENILVVPEGGSLFQLDVTLIQDGNSTVEHNIPQRRLYNDLVSLFSQTRVGYNPTLVVTYGGLAGDPYWSQAQQVWNHPLLTRHSPPEALAGRVRAVIAPADQFSDQYSARESHRLYQAGVPIAIGGHGQQPGLAAHWEIWSHVRGGASPLEALRHGTIDGARMYGFSDIGSLEAGKLADLLILDANPLEDIQNTDNIVQIMLNGRLYDAATLDETVTGNRQRQPYFWEQDGAGSNPAAATVGHMED